MGGEVSLRFSGAGRSSMLAGLVVVLLTFAFYIPAIFHSFVEWDDATVIAGNPLFNPVSWNTVGYYWTHLGENLYIPVTYTLWAALGFVGQLSAADAMRSRLNPYVFHLASVLLHTSVALTVYLLLRHLVRSPWAAAVGALFFALHPLQVEAVAFVGAMNTPLAAALGLWAVWLYLHGGAGLKPGLPVLARWRSPSFIAATALLLAAMLSKPTAVVLPLMAVLIETALVHHAQGWRMPWVAILPWLAISGAFAACARAFQHASAVRPATPWQHLLIAGNAGAFYLHKLVFPWPLAIDYGQAPQRTIGMVGAGLPFAILALVIAIDFVGVRLRRGRRHWLSLAILLAIAGVLPNSGIVPFDFQLISTAADRYVYLAMIGPSLLVAVMMMWMSQLSRSIRLAACASLMVALTALAVLTEQQIQTWSDGTTLFHHAISVNADSWISYANLAYIEAESNPPQALMDCRQAIWLNPSNAIAWNTLGSLLIERGERDQAIKAFDIAHKLQPDVIQFSRNAANARAGK